MGDAVSGKVIAIIGRGTPGMRAVAVALAEEGADIAVATMAPTQEEEFATASIANELWAIGREQISHVLDASDGEAVEQFALRVRAELGECTALVIIGDGEVGTNGFSRVTRIGESDQAAMIAEARQAIG